LIIDVLSEQYFSYIYMLTNNKSFGKK